MKQLTYRKTILIFITLMIFAPLSGIAQPGNPGGDPFATPVNGGVVFVVVIAFMYGVYKVYQLTKKTRAENINR